MARHAVEGFCQDLCFPAVSRRNCQMMRGIDIEFGIELSYIGDPLPIRRPCWRSVFAGIRCDLYEVRAFIAILRNHYPDVAVGRAVRIRYRAVAAESDLLPI